MDRYVSKEFGFIEFGSLPIRKKHIFHVQYFYHYSVCDPKHYAIGTLIYTLGIFKIT